MPKYKDVEKMIANLSAMKKEYDGITLDGIITALEKEEVVDVAPVVHGVWCMEKDGAAYCTACKIKMNPFVFGYPRCPLCGAKMDGGNT